jgi:hypothetical protein
MIVEERIYRLYPRKVGEFLRIYEEHGLAIHCKILGNLLGYFTTDVGHLNQVVHFWGFKSHNDRARRRARLVKNKEWNACVDLLVPLIISQENRILVPTRFSPIK